MSSISARIFPTTSASTSLSATAAPTVQTLSNGAASKSSSAALLPNFLFGPADIVVALGQDGVVANTLKYLNGQPLIGVNPDAKRYDGELLPSVPDDLCRCCAKVAATARIKARDHGEGHAEQRPGAPCGQRPLHRSAHPHLGAL